MPLVKQDRTLPNIHAQQGTQTGVSFKKKIDEPTQIFFCESRRNSLLRELKRSPSYAAEGLRFLGG